MAINTEAFAVGVFVKTLTIPSVTAEVGDTEIVLTIDANEETDVIYARYQSYENGGWGAWSAESETFKRTGDGDITVTGLTNGTRYRFGVYSKHQNRMSDWALVESIPYDGVCTPVDTDLDDKLVPKALALLNKFGRCGVFHAPTSYNYDPDTGRNQKVSVIQYERKVAPIMGFDQKYIDGDVILASDGRTFVADSGLGFTPEPGHRLSVDSETWRIIAVKPLRSGVQVAAWELHLRK